MSQTPAVEQEVPATPVANNETPAAPEAPQPETPQVETPPEPTVAELQAALAAEKAKTARAVEEEKKAHAKRSELETELSGFRAATEAAEQERLANMTLAEKLAEETKKYEQRRRLQGGVHPLTQGDGQAEADRAFLESAAIKPLLDALSAGVLDADTK